MTMLAMPADARMLAPNCRTESKSIDASVKIPCPGFGYHDVVAQEGS